MGCSLDSFTILTSCNCIHGSNETFAVIQAYRDQTEKRAILCHHHWNAGKGMALDASDSNQSNSVSSSVVSVLPSGSSVNDDGTRSININPITRDSTIE